MRLDDCRGRLFLPLAVGVPDGMAAGYFYLFFLYLPQFAFLKG